MATSLVAALHARSDTPITLVGGHNGIYEVTVDGTLIYTNQGSCAQGFPSDAEIVDQIADRLGFEPASALVGASVASPDEGPSCPLPAEPGTTNQPLAQPDGSCGCSPVSDAAQAARPQNECCAPTSPTNDNRRCGATDPAESAGASCCGPSEPATENNSSCC